MNIPRLIEEIKKRPCIYDFFDKDYRNSDHKADSWKEVSLVLNQPVRDLKVEWKKLRDCYRAALYRRCNKGGSRHFRPWVYESKMQFVRPFLTGKPDLNEKDRSAPKTDAERSRAYRARKRAERATKKKVPKTSTERVREYRARKRLLRESYEMLSSAEEGQTSTVNRPQSTLEQRMKAQDRTGFSGNVCVVEDGNDAIDNIIIEDPRSVETGSNSDTLSERRYDDLDYFFASACASTRKLPRLQQLKVKQEILNLISSIEEEQLLTGSSEEVHSQSPSNSSTGHSDMLSLFHPDFRLPSESDHSPEPLTHVKIEMVELEPLL